MSDIEESRPDHMIIEQHRPDGHGMMDQKYGKGMRSPMLEQLPQRSDIEIPGDQY